MTWALDTAAVTAVLGAVAGLGVPALIARIPEPDPRPPNPLHSETDSAARAAGRNDEADAELVPAPSAPVAVAPSASQDKEPYAVIAASPGLAWRAAVASAGAAGLVGVAIGWQWSLVPLLVLVPVGVALAVVDWRTRLLPTKVIAPTYVVVGVLAVAATALDSDWPSLLRAVWGLVLARGAFWLLWLVYPRGMGFGDVRLAGVLGLALGLLGWEELAVGVYAGFVLGGVGGLLLSAARVVDRGSYPFGPFMLLGALVGVVWGEPLVALLVGRP